MDEIPIEQLEQRFRTLPEAIQDALTSRELTGRVVDIAEKHEVSESQLEEVVREVGLVLLMGMPLQTLRQKLLGSISLPPDRIDMLVQEIENQIITPLTARTSYSETDLRSQQRTAQEPNISQGPTQKSPHLVRAGWKPKHAPDARSTERPISSSLIRKQVEKRRFDEHEREHPETQKETPKPKPYWPDPYRESLDGK